ncbi:hypothetical protein [Chengkuizengella axinellae]
MKLDQIKTFHILDFINSLE